MLILPLGRVGLGFVDVFWLKTFIQKKLIWKNALESARAACTLASS